MNLIEAKQLLRKNGYKLIKEDAYMDAMDQELDELVAPKRRLGDGYTEGNVTLTYACKDETNLDAYLDKFLDGTANDRAKKALGRLFDLCINGENIDKIKNMELGDTVTFTVIPAWYGKFPATSNHVRSYISNYGKETVKKMIGLACTKGNIAELKA